MKIQPLYKFGQKFEIELKGNYKNTKIEIAQKVIGFISEIKVRGTSTKDSYEYGITTDMPKCYHRGEPPFIYLMEDELEHLIMKE
jgi:hypothetical protein